METIEISNFTDLPFGENTHQVAAIAKIEEGIDYEILSENKDLTYIDFLNLTSAVKILAEFFDVDVLDYQELTPEISVQPVDRIRI